MKRIVTVENLYQQAMKNSRRASGIGSARTMRRGHAVYEVIIDRNARIAYLKHYGTVTIKYHLQDRELLEWYGEGVSDRDSMNTFVSCLQEDRYYFRYGSKMGFQMEHEGRLIPIEEANQSIWVGLS